MQGGIGLKKILLAVVLVLTLCGAATAFAKRGYIPEGEPLIYRGLRVTENGVNVTILNRGDKDVVFNAALAFVDGRRRHVQQRQDGVIRREAREEEPGRQCEGNDIDERGQPAGKAVLDELNERVCGAAVAEKLRNGFSERARKGNGGGGSGCGFL